MCSARVSTLRCGNADDRWFCWGLTARQPLWVTLWRLPEKGRKEIEEIVEGMKKRDRKERGNWMKVKKQKKQTHYPSTLTCYKDSRPCPTASQYQLDSRWRKMHETFATPDHHLNIDIYYKWVCSVFPCFFMWECRWSMCIQMCWFFVFTFLCGNADERCVSNWVGSVFPCSYREMLIIIVYQNGIVWCFYVPLLECRLSLCSACVGSVFLVSFRERWCSLCIKMSYFCISTFLLVMLMIDVYQIELVPFSKFLCWYADNRSVPKMCWFPVPALLWGILMIAV